MADERRYLNLPRGANGGAFFWAGANGRVNWDRVGGVVRPSQPAQEAPAGTRGKAWRGLLVTGH